jgi:hypothetical protein
VTTAADAQYLQRQLILQDIASPLSDVRPASCPVDPMRRHWLGRPPFSAAAARTAQRLQSIGRLFEWAYGYRAATHHFQRDTRRAPSAGALYPTELFVVVEDTGWEVLYYHFAGHTFYRVDVPRAAAVAEALNLSHGSTGVLFNAILWRTVQRYGVRGYRYCLLDGAHVASALVHAAWACGQPISITPGVLTRQLEQLLDLGHGEALIAAMCASEPGKEAPVPEPAVPPATFHPPSDITEYPPLLSPLLNRVLALHRSTLPYGRAPSRASLACPASGTDLDRLAIWGRDRYSAKDFTGEAVTADVYRHVVDIATTPPDVAFGTGGRLVAYAIRLHVAGELPGCTPLQTSDAAQHPDLNGSTLAHEWWLASQNQSIVKRCAFGIVVGTAEDELVALGPSGYRETVLNAGAVCAALYRAAARLSLGTTTIGGFSDQAIAHLIGARGIHPIVVQVFGVPVVNADKVDVAHMARTPAGLRPL